MVGSGSLNASTTNTITNTTTATGGAGSAFNTSTVAGNRIKNVAAAYSGNVDMSYSMGGQGILQANQNTGANATQQNSVALTSYGGRQRRWPERLQPDTYLLLLSNKHVVELSAPPLSWGRCGPLLSANDNG